ncbi:hypothetical protein DFH07DRAFT_1007902, partial [Mycena maculata]
FAVWYLISVLDLATVWEALFAYDLLIFAIILFRSSQLRRRNRTPGAFPPLISLLRRDGATYFVAMALANLLNIISFYVGGPFLKGGLSTFATRRVPSSNPVAHSQHIWLGGISVSVTLTSRLMLNLHALADRGLYTEAVTNEPALTGQTLDSMFDQTYTLGETIELETRRMHGYHVPSWSADSQSLLYREDFEGIPSILLGRNAGTAHADLALLQARPYITIQSLSDPLLGGKWVTPSITSSMLKWLTRLRIEKIYLEIGWIDPNSKCRASSRTGTASTDAEGAFSEDLADDSCDEHPVFPEIPELVKMLQRRMDREST